MKFTWDDIVAVYLSQPWWFWPLGLFAFWIGTKALFKAARKYAEQPFITENSFQQCRVRVDYRASTITLPHGDTYPVSAVRGLRWEDHITAGSYRAYIEIDDLKRPIRLVLFSTPHGPEEFISRLRTAIAQAGGPRFSITRSESIELLERDFTDLAKPTTATRVSGHGRRITLASDGL